MSNINKVSISANFPNLSQNRKLYLSISSKSRSKDFFPNILNTPIYNSQSLSIPPYNNPFHAIGLTKRNSPFLLLEKNKSLKLSSNNFYVTGIQYREGRNYIMKNSSSLPTFKSQNNNKNSKNILYSAKINKKEEEDDTPSLKYLGSLIKFKKTKNNFLKNNKKKIIPQEKRQDYIDYINKKRKIFFNINSTSQYVHEKNVNYLIHTLKKTKSYKILQPNYILKARNPKEEMTEMRDKVPNLPFNTQKLIEQIRNLFSQDYKFNYSQFNETFYNDFENKVNFIEDIYRVPIFKNNLVKIILNKNESLGFEEWKNINVINSTTWNYLNRLKRKLQREKDEKLKREKELELKRKEEEELIFIKNKNQSKEEENVKEEISDNEDDKNKKIVKEEENYSNIMINIEKEEKLKLQQYEDLYIIEEYFLHKNNYNNDNVSIATDKLRYLFFHVNENIYK